VQLAAALLALESARDCARAELHLAGAEGFLWSSPAARRLRRLDAAERALGGSSALRRRLGRLVLSSPARLFA
jgi:alkylation response protein AidB-like acyl-CoA dehydrogenase